MLGALNWSDMNVLRLWEDIGESWKTQIKHRENMQTKNEVW